MRNVESHLLEDKMDEAVTHYINSHQPSETVHVDANSLPLNVQDENGRVVTVMHTQNFPSQMCRQLSVGEGAWADDLLDSESRFAALVAHLAEHSRPTHQTHGHLKVPTVRGDVDTSVILDTPMRLFNGQSLDQQQESIVVEVPSLPPLPPLQDMKRCPETDWFNKGKSSLKDNTHILEEDGQVLDIAAGASPVQKQNKKSLPHKKRISKKLKRTNGSSTPQQDLVVIRCNEEIQEIQEEILPDNFVASVQHPQHLPEETHHITHEMRAMFICQLCGEFYGEEQLKFYQHLKQHYEPHATIIIENPVPDLGIDKMTNTCIVDNVPTLPDSIVELSLENTVPKTMYQPIDKHILYTSDKSLNYNKVYQTMDKEPETDKNDIYREDLDKLEMYFCTKCNKSFRKQKQCEAHIKEVHSNPKQIDDMGEFSEPEDLMEGIHVAVTAVAEEGASGGEGGEQYEHEQHDHALLPHLTIENGHVHQEHVRQWYLRNGASPPVPICTCGGSGYCTTCTHTQVQPMHTHAHIPHTQTQTQTQTQIIHTSSLPTCLGSIPVSLPTSLPSQTSVQTQSITQRNVEQKEETLQRIFEPEPPQETPTFSEVPAPKTPDVKVKEEPGTEKSDKKKNKVFQCTQCDRTFGHRNSLLYHILMHSERQEVCKECGKSFYTANALKVHKRVHNGDRPCKCDECGKGFRQWSDLKYHKASIHSDKKQYKCEFCNKEFARRYSLNIHRRIHTGERNYKCEYCNKSFRASSYRLSHMRTHTGSRPYKCTQCDKSFRVMYDLRRHMLIHEKIRVRTDDPKKPKEKKVNDAKIDLKAEKVKSEPKKSENIRLPILKSLLDKKQAKLPKKSPKKPNVQSRDMKMSVYDFDARNEYKFKEEFTRKDTYSEMRLERDDDRDLTSLRCLKTQVDHVDVEDRLVYSRENTDGKMQVYTQIEKSKDYDGPIVTNTVSLTDLRNLDRDVRDSRTELHGESLENGFFEKLSAFYNIPAV